MTSWVVVSIFFLFSPRFGEDFSDGLKPPTRWRLYFCFAVKPYLWTNSRFLRKQYLSEQTPTFIYTVRPTNVLCGWISIIGDLPTQKKRQTTVMFLDPKRHVPPATQRQGARLLELLSKHDLAKLLGSLSILVKVGCYISILKQKKQVYHFCMKSQGGVPYSYTVELWGPYKWPKIHG